MKICIFAGTFNPIHNAHLKMAQFVLDNLGYDKILFIPAYKPPHKNYNPYMSNHRFEMVKLAVQNNPKFEVSDIEFKRESKSYTYLTITEILNQIQEYTNKISFIIGTDAFKQIESWYETDKLKKIVDFIVFIRENETVNLDYLCKKGYNFQFAQMKFLNISSTKIREKIKKDIEN